MGDDLQKELAVLATMNQLPGRRAAQGESAEHEWAGVVRQLLLSALTLFSDELDCVELLEPQLRDRNRVKYLANRYHTGRLFAPLCPLAVLLSWFGLCGKSKGISRWCVRIHHRSAERFASADPKRRCWNESLVALVCPKVCPR